MGKELNPPLLGKKKIAAIFHTINVIVKKRGKKENQSSEHPDGAFLGGFHPPAKKHFTV